MPGPRQPPAAWPWAGEGRTHPHSFQADPCHRRLRQPEHKVLQQLRNCGNDVFVVTEVLQTQKEVKVTQARKQEGSGQFALLGPISLQVRGMGHGSGRGREGRRGCPLQPTQPHDPEPSPEPMSIPQGQGQGHRSRKKTVTIPSGSILAFQVAQLLIDSDWGELELGCLLGPKPHGRGRHSAAQLPGWLRWHVGGGAHGANSAQ